MQRTGFAWRQRFRRVDEQICALILQIWAFLKWRLTSQHTLLIRVRLRLFFSSSCSRAGSDSPPFKAKLRSLSGCLRRSQRAGGENSIYPQTNVTLSTTRVTKTNTGLFWLITAGTVWGDPGQRAWRQVMMLLCVSGLEGSLWITAECEYASEFII